MSISQADKAKKFRALHEAPGAFVIANPWDGGSARILEGLGYQALATSSGACAGSNAGPCPRSARRYGRSGRSVGLALPRASGGDANYGTSLRTSTSLIRCSPLRLHESNRSR